MTSVIGDTKTLSYLPPTLRLSNRGNGQQSSHASRAPPPTPVKPQSTFKSIRKRIPYAPPFGTKTDPTSESSDKLIKTDRAALLNHDQCKQATAKTKELLQVHSMDPQQDAINRILTGVESIQTLTRETVEALQNTIVGRVAINKFKVRNEWSQIRERFQTK